jgi:3-phosphoshikimate 1-carboxyvinyltransferase
MGKIVVNPIRRLKGVINLPGDKSISHRAIMLGSIAQGITRIRNFPDSKDCQRTINAFGTLGIEIKQIRNPESKIPAEVIIKGKGLEGLSNSKISIYLGNSGTSMRLLAGILAGQKFDSKLTGDRSLSRRPMKRIIEPLRLMGASIKAEVRSQKPGTEQDYPPLEIQGSKLRGIDYVMPVASAQVKSAILLAGIFAQGLTRITEPVPSRDHTERMLKFFGADVSIRAKTIYLTGSRELKGNLIDVPGDISSAAFFLAAAALKKGACLTLVSVGLNPTRTAILDILRRMGAKIEIVNKKTRCFEPGGDVVIRGGDLKGIEIRGDIIPKIIDEIPIIMVVSALAKGETVIEGAGELRVKETDRISSMVSNLKMLGANIKERKDGVLIHGLRHLTGGRVKSFGDHRTAMSMVIAGLNAQGSTIIENTDCINTSFPGFMDVLKGVS